MAIGTITREVDSSLYTNVTDTSPVLAVVGAATKGEIGVPTLCTSLKDFRGKFGSLDPNCMAPYAAEWYLKKVARVYFVRAAGASAAKGKVVIPGTKINHVVPDPIEPEYENLEFTEVFQAAGETVAENLDRENVLVNELSVYLNGDPMTYVDTVEGVANYKVNEDDGATAAITLATGEVKLTGVVNDDMIIVNYAQKVIKGFDATEDVATLVTGTTEYSFTLEHLPVFVDKVTIGDTDYEVVNGGDEAIATNEDEDFSVIINYATGKVDVNVTDPIDAQVVKVAYMWGENIPEQPEPYDETIEVESVFTLATNEMTTTYNGYNVNISNVAEDGSFDIVVRLNDDTDPIVKLSKVCLDSEADNYIGAKILDTEFNLFKVDDVAATVTAGIYQITGGNIGLEGIDASIAKCLEALNDTNMSIDILSVPDSQSAGIITQGLSLCATRGDTLYLVDTPAHLAYDEAIKWVSGKGDYDDHAAFNSSYGACYYAWQYIYDSVNDKNVLVPPCVLVAPVIAASELATEAWYAPAGMSRGVVENAISSEFKPTDDEVNALYEARINPIITHDTAGLVVWGQKTLLGTTTALDRVNVRRLMTYVKRLVRNVCQFLTFEPNDTATWAMFSDMLDPYFRSIVENRGMYAYKIVPMEDTVTDADIDNNQMPGQIFIKPTKSAEYIPIDIVITSTGVEI